MAELTTEELDNFNKDFKELQEKHGVNIKISTEHKIVVTKPDPVKTETPKTE